MNENSASPISSGRLIGSCVLALILGAVWFLLRRRQGSWIPRQLFFAPLSYVIAHGLIKGTGTVSFFFERDLFSILFLTAALYALLTLLWQIWLRRRAAA